MMRIGFWGAGNIAASRHVPEAANEIGVGIAGYYDTNTSRAIALSEKYGGIVYENPEAMLEDRSVDAIVVSVINKSHASSTIQALRHGKHVLCEKPMALTLSEAIEMRDTAQTSGKILMIGHNLRLEPAFQQAKKWLDQGDLGPVLSFEMVIGNEGPEPQGASAQELDALWFFRKAQAGMGVAGDIAIHGAEALQWLLDGSISQVTGYAACLQKRLGDGRPIEVEDSTAFLLRTSNGAIGTLSASWCYVDGWTSHVTFHCERACLRVYPEPGIALSITWRDGSIHKEAALPKSSWPHGSGVMHMFVQSIATKEPPLLGADAGIAALKIILAGLESSRTGLPVNLR